MASVRAKILAEIAELQKCQMQASRDAVFGGWTEEEATAYQTRSDRIAKLRCKLALADGGHASREPAL